MTVKEVAAMVQLSVITIRRYTARNEIPFHKIFRAVRYKKSEIEQWVENREREREAAKGNGEKTEGGLFDEAESGGKV